MSLPLRHAWDERINQGIAPRYRDRQLACDVIKVMPGEYEVLECGDYALVTLLGSCVSACIRDPLLGIGGMNHFMLPEAELGGSENARYGAFAMEVLINELIKRGALRKRLEAKVFGGGNIIRGMKLNAVGDRNAAFVIDYLAAEGIKVVAKDLGGDVARKVAYWVDSGKVLVRHLPVAATAADLAAEQVYHRQLRSEPTVGDVELFD